MTAEVLDYRIKQIKHITGIDIFDDKSFDEALFKLIGIYSNLKKENKEIRAKAIDEFVEKAYFILGCEDSDIYCKETIKEIAKQMKAGGKNEN